MIDLMSSQKKALFSILNSAAKARRAEIDLVLEIATERRVQSGLFLGMELVDTTSWGDGDFAPKVLGCYEAELQRALITASLHSPATIINVGCAEGYYAVGLGRLLPQATVFAFDISEAAQTACRLNAEANGVAERVEIGGECTPDHLSALASRPGHCLVVMDCEGAEMTLLDPALVPGLSECDIIVECHDFLNPAITPTLIERLSPTHEIDTIGEGARDPNLYPVLRRLSSLDRWLAINENRPEAMNWLACWSRSAV